MEQREREHAIMEGEMNAATDNYFDARPQIIRTRDRETTFEAGFKAGFKCYVKYLRSLPLRKPRERRKAQEIIQNYCADRDLLELAAKAAGYDYRPQNSVIVVDGIPGRWNPIEYDGDAFRLAVELWIDTGVRQADEEAWAVGPGTAIMREPMEGDYLAAMRRAIVRAAAATIFYN